MAEEPRRSELTDAAWLMTQSAALLILHRMREIEEALLDPTERWTALRAALERFSTTERPS